MVKWVATVPLDLALTRMVMTPFSPALSDKVDGVTVRSLWPRVRPDTFKSAVPGLGNGEFEFLLLADPHFAEIQGLLVGRDFRISRHREYDREFQNFGERIVGVETNDGPFGSGGELGCVTPKVRVDDLPAVTLPFSGETLNQPGENPSKALSKLSLPGATILPS